MTNAAAKIKRLMTYKCEDRFMVYDRRTNLGVVIAPDEEGLFKLEAFGGKEILEQGLDERILFDPFAIPHTELI